MHTGGISQIVGENREAEVTLCLPTVLYNSLLMSEDMFSLPLLTKEINLLQLCFSSYQRVEYSLFKTMH